MIELLKSSYSSKSDNFLLPLTGLGKNLRYKVKSYLFWEEYSIEDYNLILRISYDDKEDFKKYCKANIYPILDKNCYLIEIHECSGEAILILDISEWAMDIEMFLKGRYSRFSKSAKELITQYHTFYQGRSPKILIDIATAINPHEKFEVLEGLSGLEYVIKHYSLPEKEMLRLGEIVSLYSKKDETLTLECDIMSHLL